MDRDELIVAAGLYHDRIMSKGGCYRPTNGTEPLITHFLADFALESYEAGRRAERERIIQELGRISDTSDSFDIHSMRVETFLDELRQTDPADSGE